MNVAELINLIGFKLDKSSYNAVQDATSNIMQSMEGLAKKASTFFTAPLLALAGTAVKLYSIENTAAMQVERTLKSTGNAAKKSLQELLNEAYNIQRETILEDDEVIQHVTNRLLTFQNIAGDQFTRAQKVITDISAYLDPAMNNIAEIALQVGKAMNDPIQGLTALRRTGIQFSESQMKLFENTWKMGKQAEAQDLILSELEKRYKGASKVVAENSTGIKQWRVALSDILVLFGKDLFPAFRKFMDWLIDLTYKFTERLTPSVRKTLLIFVGFLAIIAPITLGLFALGKAGLFVNGVMASMGIATAKSNLGVLGTLGKYAIFLSVFVVIALVLYGIFNDIYVYLHGGKSLIGEFLPAWKELGPKLYESLKPYMILMGDLWKSLKKTGLEAINYMYDIFDGRATEASEHFDKFIEHLGVSVGNAGEIILPAIWKIYEVVTNALLDIIAELIVRITVTFDSMLLSFEKSIWRWVTKIFNIFVDFIDKINKNITNKIIDKLTGIIPRGVLETLQRFTGVEPRFGDWRNEPALQNNMLPVPYNSLRNGGETKMIKEVKVTVNAGLNVPHGTSEYQKNYLTKTVQDLFNESLNNLTRNLVQGLPGVE